MDDARVFTVEVTPRVEVLIVEDDPTSQKDSPTYFLRRALCPWGEGKRGIFHVRRSSPARIPDLAKDAPDVVVLAATAQATDKLWGQLEAFVARGGGLLAFLGPEAGDAYRTDAAKALLGVEVGHPGAAPPQSPFRLRVVSQQNAIVQGLKGARADVGAMRFSQYHQVTPSPEAEEVLGFGRDRPALVLSRHGGKVAVFAGPPDERWGDFVTVSAYLPFCHETLLYLASRVATGISAHTVEDYVPIAYDAAGGKAVVALTRPGAQEAEELAQGDTPGQMAYGKTDVPGYYRLDFRRGGEKWRGGFAVNCAPAETHFDRVPFESVKAAIRARKVERLTDVSRLDFARYAGKSSMKEITPLIALMVLLLLCLEGFMANRFYKEPAVTPEPEEEASAKT